MRRALDAGHAAAQILPANVGQNVEQTDELRIAFDGDAVLFSDEAERVYKRDGLDAFTASEVERGQGAAVGRAVQELPRGAAPHPVGVLRPSARRSAPRS